MINLEKRHDILREWEKFGDFKPTDSEIIRPYLLSSWERSREYGVKRNLKTYPAVSSGELINKIFENRKMLQIAVPYMKKIVEFINDPESMILITDKNGIVLELFGSDEIKKVESAPKLGSSMLEKDIGTNGVGTAIVENRTLDIWAGEHFLEGLHIWYSSADTIHDSSGRIIGCLCLMCRWDLVNTHTLGMVGGVSGAIERQFQIEETLAQKILEVKKQQAIVESINEGIVVIDAEEKITSLNSHAKLMLDIADKNVIGSSIYETIISGVNFFKIMTGGVNIYDREATLKLANKMFHCTMSTSLIQSEGSINGMVITIRESKTLHQLAGKIAGSRAYISFSDIIGNSLALQEAIKLAKTAGRSKSNVLLLGESGTGKELFAQSIHNHSDRANNSFVAVNCGAIPRDLVESELFGYEGGAFTGSRKEGRPGKFELADEGTIFLDEIGDMPLDAQVNLLRVLQNSEVVRVGGTYPKKINVRVIAATNHDLKRAVEQKTFRDDLYYRLNVLSITIPPLKERVEDISSLANHFARKAAHNLNKTISGISLKAMLLLESCNWPGNVRELENVIERAVNIMEKTVIAESDLPDYIRGSVIEVPVLEPQSLKAKEYESIALMLAETSGNLRESAKRLGIARGTLYKKISKYGIDVAKFR
ncbi:MAG: sigma-54-dependent Fis family transcriptional regulator [bacterium]